MRAPTGIPEIRARAEANAKTLPRRNINVATTRELTVTGSAGPINARLYLPTYGDPHPLTVFFHGGGFISGSLATHDHLCCELAQGAATAVLSIDYRLLPEHPVAAAIDDAYAALCWAADHGTELGVDSTRLALAGDSVGGHLALASSLRARDEGGPHIKAQLLLYPPVDFTGTTYPSIEENGEGFGLTAEQNSMLQALIAPTREIAEDPLVSPLRFADFADLPPSLVATAEFDILRDEGTALAAALRSAGVDVTHHSCQGMIHGFGNLTGVSTAAAAALDAATNWLRQHLDNPHSGR
ncbi:acetyl esterase [Neorhizobium sp. JUb45]|nr:acetyl esterase [Neorhizobium sp. JUb45]